MSILDSLIARTLPVIPRPFVWRVARRYIAGVGLDDAVKAIADLGRRGLRATLDILGEDSANREMTFQARDSYLAAIDRIEAENLPSGVSVKLTQLGLRMDPALARENLEQIATRAARSGRFVRIDMEDSSTTTTTIDIYRAVRKVHENVGLVLQAYLRRTLEDARELLPLGADIRLCKGIYTEPERIAFQGFEEIRKNFLEVLATLLRGGAKVALATHDPYLVEEGIRIGQAYDPGRVRHEFQMLFGVGERMWDSLIDRGYKLRVYVPFGSHWYPYSLRRLRENPRIAGHVFRDYFGK